MMAPLPPETTQRFFLDYATANRQHTLMVRTTTPQAATTFSTVMDAFLDAIAPTIYAIVIVGARVAQVGSNITSPIAWGGSAGYGATAEPLDLAPRQLCFLGRSTDGRRMRMYLFGYEGATHGDYRISRSENTDVDAAYNVMEANPSFWASISGNVTTKYEYVDINFNSYWERDLRG
jgi:hypothetical protein